MNKSCLFPTKSRLQVAIALQSLLNTADRAAIASIHHAVAGNEDLAQAAAFIFLLCLRRLELSLKPALWPQGIPYRVQALRQDRAETKQALTIIRGWRRRWPRMLDQPKGD